MIIQYYTPVIYSMVMSSYLHNFVISSSMTDGDTADKPDTVIFFSKDFLILVVAEQIFIVNLMCMHTL